MMEPVGRRTFRLWAGLPGDFSVPILLQGTAVRFRKFLSMPGRFLIPLVLLVGMPLSLSAAEVAHVPFFLTAEHKLTGPLPSADFFFQLPGHVEFVGQQEVRVRYRASGLLIPDISTATFELNGKPIKSLRLPGGGDAGAVEVAIPVGPVDIRAGWNKLSVRCLLQTTEVECRDVDNPACWFVMEKGSGLVLGYQRTRIFPEMGRFPASLTEEQLLRQDELVEGFPADKVRHVVAIYIAGRSEDVVLRGLVTAAARIGQPGYLPARALRIGSASDWARQCGETNGIIIGLAADLAGIDIPAETRFAVGSLQAGEGFLGEFIVGEDPSEQRRWVLVSGGDADGLEKAVLTLGSGDALGGALSNSWIVRDAPVLAPWTARLAVPSGVPQTFEELFGGSLTLKGVFRNRATAVWFLPPGYETAPGGELALMIAHSSGMDKNSAVQFEMNGTRLPGIPLGVATESQATVKLSIPTGITGVSPNSLVVDSYLDIGTTDCSHRNEERAWVDFAPDSRILVASRPIGIDGLERLGYLLTRDAFMRRACVLLPQDAPDEDLAVAARVALEAGRKLGAMPVLWPQAAWYAAGRPIPGAAVATTSVLLLGKVGDWRQALPPGTPLSVDALPGKPSLLLQGAEVPFSALEKGMVFAQFLKSPWSADNCVVAVGGVETVGGEPAVKLLTDPDLLSKLAGTVGGTDPRGRIFQYDVRVSNPKSLSETVSNSLPQGLTSEQTTEKLEAAQGLQSYLSTRNLVIAGLFLAVVLYLVRTQVLLLKAKAEARRGTSRNDSQSG